MALANSYWLIISSIRATKRLHDAVLDKIQRAPMVLIDLLKTHGRYRFSEWFVKHLRLKSIQQRCESTTKNSCINNVKFTLLNISSNRCLTIRLESLEGLIIWLIV